MRQALARYLVWLSIIASAKLLYTQLPFYGTSSFRANEIFFEYLLMASLYGGFPYFVLTLIFKSSRVEDFYDPAVRIIHIVKQMGLALFADKPSTSGAQHTPENPFRVLKNPTNKKVLLNILMRGYFIPIMIAQVLANLVSSINIYQSLQAQWQFLSFLVMVSAVLWTTDIVNAALNYGLESRWLENRSRSVDLTAGGWLVCFACYAPLNEITGSFFPFGPHAATGLEQDLVFSGVVTLTALKVLEVVLLGFQIYSNVSLGPSIVNVTFKKLQNKGLYSLIRHPGTTFKLLLWFSQGAFYKQFWTLKFVYGYSMWATLYILRAFTEERHLQKFPEYRQYMQQVKKRFIPGLF